MGIKISKTAVQRVSVEDDGPYVPGSRIKVSFEGGDVLFFRKMRGYRNYSQYYVDEALSSFELVQKLYGLDEDRSEDFEKELSAQEVGVPVISSVLSVLNEEQIRSLNALYLNRFDDVLIGEPMMLWLSSLVRGGGTGVETPLPISDVEAVVISDAP